MTPKKEKRADILLEYQNYFEPPPQANQVMRAKAVSNDAPTVQTWKPKWLANIKANHAKFGPFKDRSIGKFFNMHKNKPCIVAGAGPSLKRNGEDLKKKGDITLVSCLHNFHYMVDRDIDVDFYVTLDAGDVTIEEVSEGGTKTADEYWNATKGKILLAYIGTSPLLLEKWQGEFYFFNHPVPDDDFMTQIQAIEHFTPALSSGGNVLGACVYFAKGFLGCNPIAYVGADFCFSYDKKFHAWDSKYDANLGMVMKAFDVFGNKVLTWASYANFKAHFEWLSMKIPGIWINCTEGGTLGSYADGNISTIRQMDLCEFIEMYNLTEHIRPNVEAPDQGLGFILF
jgi:hypothetical protein